MFGGLAFHRGQHGRGRKRPFFRDSSRRRTSQSKEVIVGLSAESREQVDDLADRAIEAGGLRWENRRDDGVMNMRGFHDLNEHQWPFIYMDISAILEANAAAPRTAPPEARRRGSRPRPRCRAPPCAAAPREQPRRQRARAEAWPQGSEGRERGRPPKRGRTVPGRPASTPWPGRRRLARAQPGARGDRVPQARLSPEGRACRHASAASAPVSSPVAVRLASSCSTRSRGSPEEGWPRPNRSTIPRSRHRSSHRAVRRSRHRSNHRSEAESGLHQERDPARAAAESGRRQARSARPSRQRARRPERRDKGGSEGWACA
jgi:hypothetical protein